MSDFQVSASFTRPSDTTAYADNDLVANSTTAGSVVPLTFTIGGARNIKIMKAILLKSSVTVTNASFTLHLYKDSPTVANGDNGAYSSSTSGFIGSIAFVGTGQNVQTDDCAIPTDLTTPLFATLDSDSTIYGLVSAEAAYGPASAEVFTLTLMGDKNVG